MSVTDETAKGPEHVELTFDVQGMSCSSCVPRVQRALERQGGVEHAAVNFATARADVVIVSSAPPASQESCRGVTVVTDATGRLADGFAMRRPLDRGAPVGYAVVDRTGTIRYATLDPSVVSGLREVDTVVEATP